MGLGLVAPILKTTKYVSFSSLSLVGKGSDEVDLWLGYCAFHCGDYKRAMLEYEALIHTAASTGKKPAKVSQRKRKYCTFGYPDPSPLYTLLCKCMEA